MLKELRCPSCGSESKFVFWLKNNFVEVDKSFKIVQSNLIGYNVDQVLNKSEIEKLISECKTNGSVECDCKKCSNDKTIEAELENGDVEEGLAEKVLNQLVRQMDNIVETEMIENEHIPHESTLIGSPFLKMICSCGSDNVSLMNHNDNIDSADFGKFTLFKFTSFAYSPEDGEVSVLGSCYECQDESLLTIVMKDGTVFDGDESKACEYAIKNWDSLITTNTKNVVLLNKVSYNCSCHDKDKKCSDTISLNIPGDVVEFRNSDLHLYGSFNGKNYEQMDGNDLNKLISLAETTPGNISFKCDGCSKLVNTVSFEFDDGTMLDNFDGLKYLAKTKNVVTTSTHSNNTGNTMTDYEREVEKLKKWINSLKPKTVKAGRKAAQISIVDFKQKLYDATPEDERDESIEDMGDYSWGCLISSLKFSNQTLQKDLSKVQFDTENNDVDFDIHNGVAYACCRCGGDWEMPIKFFVYFDGKNIRGYIPTEGNFFNKLCNIAFGSEGGEGGEPADDNLPIMKKIEEMKTNCKDGSFPTWSTGWGDTKYDILRLAGIYHLTKKEDIDWNEDPDGIEHDHFFEPGGKEEFFTRLGMSYQPVQNVVSYYAYVDDENDCIASGRTTVAFADNYEIKTDNLTGGDSVFSPKQEWKKFYESDLKDVLNDDGSGCESYVIMSDKTVDEIREIMKNYNIPENEDIKDCGWG